MLVRLNSSLNGGSGEKWTSKNKGRMGKRQVTRGKKHEV